MTASAISGVAEAHEEAALGETLLSQYKQCSQINEQAVIKSKNIQDLVNHKMASLDKSLYMT